MSRGHYFDGYYPPSKPKAAKGGIKAQSKRGGFGESWWARRWIAVLESFQIGARLGRGRSYARSGQVLSIDIDNGSVKAKVQGSRTRPYDIVIRVKTLSEKEWGKLTDALSHQAIFAAKLLSGEMPEDIESVFTGAGLSLFPQKLKDLETDCSCPDWSNPCKHIAAAYYLLGEEFDRNPFLIFKLRGMDKEELLGNLGKLPGEADSSVPVAPPEPIVPNGETFWNGSALPGDFLGEVFIPPVRAALLKRLRGFPFWRGNASLVDTLEPVYARASQRGMDVFVGETDES